MHRRTTKKDTMDDLDEKQEPRWCFSTSKECIKTTTLRVLEYCDVYFLPIGMVLVLIIGLQWPVPGLFLAKMPTHYICVVLIFLVYGLQLTNSDLQTALKAYKAIIWAMFSILFLTPLLGTQITKTIHFATLSDENMTTEHSIVRANISAIGPTEFAIGLEVFFTVPSTFSTGAVLAALAGGNLALGVLLMLITNVAGVFSVPPLLTWMTSVDSTRVDVKGFTVLMGLFVLSVLLPTIVGKAIRIWPRVSDVVDSNTKPLRYTVLVLVILLTWPKISKAQSDHEYSSIVRMNTMAILGFTTIMHVIFLLVNWVACGLLRLELPLKKTVVIMASHKALPFAVTVVGFLPESARSRELMVLACIIAYLVVLFIDSLVVSKWATVDEDPLGHLFTDEEKYRKLSMGE